jgi:hypothetical protein
VCSVGIKIVLVGDELEVSEDPSIALVRKRPDSWRGCKAPCPKRDRESLRRNPQNRMEESQLTCDIVLHCMTLEVCHGSFLLCDNRMSMMLNNRILLIEVIDRLAEGGLVSQAPQ